MEKFIDFALKYEEGTFKAFIDVEDALDNTWFDAIRTQKDQDPETVVWIISMLECRIVTVGLGEEQITINTTTKGCPQGGVLSPLLWFLVIDKLLVDLDQQEFEEIDFADYPVIIVRGRLDSVLSERLLP
jgi:Reverse transcriptase (RNA-dependent DNA polymerase)